jgi:hypothetical protein
VRGRRFRIRLAVLAALTFAVLVPGVANAATDLGPIGFGTVVVDDARAHVYVSGPTANVVDVLDFSGNLVASIPNIPGAWGMVLGGRYLYVAEGDAGAIGRIDLNSPTFATTQIATGLPYARRLVMVDGILWTAVSPLPPTGWETLASIDPRSGHIRRFTQEYYSPDLATSLGAPGTLFLAYDAQSPGQLLRIDVSKSKLKVLASTFTNQENIQDLVVSPDGTRVIPASGWPYAFEELNATTLQPDGVVYPGNPYPSAVAVTPGRGGLLATGLNNGYSLPDIAVYPLGSTSPIFTASTFTPNGTANVLPHGLALSLDGSMLFAATASDVYATDTIFNTFQLP